MGFLWRRPFAKNQTIVTHLVYETSEKMTAFPTVQAGSQHQNVPQNLCVLNGKMNCSINISQSFLFCSKQLRHLSHFLGRKWSFLSFLDFLVLSWKFFFYFNLHLGVKQVLKSLGSFTVNRQSLTHHTNILFISTVYTTPLLPRLVDSWNIQIPSYILFLNQLSNILHLSQLELLVKSLVGKFDVSLTLNVILDPL